MYTGIPVFSAFCLSGFITIALDDLFVWNLCSKSCFLMPFEVSFRMCLNALFFILRWVSAGIPGFLICLLSLAPIRALAHLCCMTVGSHSFLLMPFRSHS